MEALSAVRHHPGDDECGAGRGGHSGGPPKWELPYAGSLIYAMALYTFYVTIMAVVNLVRYRKYQSPAMSAAKAINLAAALVSMLSLETAMLAQFGGGETFRQLMTASTGGSVCVIVVGMGVYMTVHASKQLKKLQESNNENT